MVLDMLREASRGAFDSGSVRKTYAISLSPDELEGRSMVVGLYGSDCEHAT
jgi:hypothetical protein